MQELLGLVRILSECAERLAHARRVSGTHLYIMKDEAVRIEQALRDATTMLIAAAPPAERNAWRSSW